MPKVLVKAGQRRVAPVVATVAVAASVAVEGRVKTVRAGSVVARAIA